MEEKEFIAYEYKDISIKNDKVDLYLDSIKNFGWDVISQEIDFYKTIFKLKRNYKINNREQVLQLEKKFDQSFEILSKKEGKEKDKGLIVSLILGLIGTVFMAGATFSYLGGIMWLMILLAIPGFILWIIPYFVNKKIVISSKKKLSPIVDQAYSTIFNTTESAFRLKSK